MKFRVVESLDEGRKKVDVEVKNTGILEVPEGKSVDELPQSHFESLVDKKGYEAVIRALNNLAVWNKNNNKSLSSWAKGMMDNLKEKYRKDEDFTIDDTERIETKDYSEFKELCRKIGLRTPDDIVKISNMYPYLDTMSSLRKYLRDELGNDFEAEPWEGAPYLKGQLPLEDMNAFIKLADELNIFSKEGVDMLRAKYPDYSLLDAAKQYKRERDAKLNEASIMTISHDKPIDEFEEFTKIAKEIGLETTADMVRLGNMYPNMDLLSAIKAYKAELDKEPIKEAVEAPGPVITEDSEAGEQVPPAPEIGTESGATTIINELIKSEYDAIDQYNSAIVTLRDEGRQDLVDVLTAIANDENTHVGNLLVASKLVSPQASSIADGEGEAEEILAKVGE